MGIWKKEKLFDTQIRASKRLIEKFAKKNLKEIIAHKAFFIEWSIVDNEFDLINFYLKVVKSKINWLLYLFMPVLSLYLTMIK